MKKMYKIAFDVDGTITKNPDLFKVIMKSLKERAIVYILTGNGNDYMPKKKRLEQLESLGITHEYYDKLILASAKGKKALPVREVAIEKGRICKEMKIDMLIDDMDSYCEQAKKQCGDKIITLKVK